MGKHVDSAPEVSRMKMMFDVNVYCSTMQDF